METMGTINQNIINKVKALLNFKKETNANESEINTAAALASKLIKKYKLEHLDFDKITGNIGETQVIAFLKREEGTKWEWNLLQTFAELNSCKVFGTKLGGQKAPRGIQLTLTGLEFNRELVMEQYIPLRDQFRKLSKFRYSEWETEAMSKLKSKFSWLDKSNFQSMQKDGAIPKRTSYLGSYLLGTTYGIQKKIKEMNESEFTEEENNKYALVILKESEEVNNYLLKEHPEIKKASMSTLRAGMVPEALNQGIKDGNTMFKQKSIA